jgi:hypothetical protein
MINEFQKGYQLRINWVKDENGDLLVDYYNTLNRWKNYFSQKFNVHRVSDVRHVGVPTAASLVPEPSSRGWHCCCAFKK